MLKKGHYSCQRSTDHKTGDKQSNTKKHISVEQSSIEHSTCENHIDSKHNTSYQQSNRCEDKMTRNSTQVKSQWASSKTQLKNKVTLSTAHVKIYLF